MSLRWSFTILGLLILGILSFPLRYLVSQVFFGDSTCPQVQYYKGKKAINAANIYEATMIDYVRAKACANLIKESKRYYDLAERNLRNQHYEHALANLDHSVLLYPGIYNLAQRAKLELVFGDTVKGMEANIKQVNKKIEYYLNAKRKYQLSLRIAGNSGDKKMSKLIVRKIGCIDRSLASTNIVSATCGKN